jgi:AraC-like DNA-binding protein
MKAHSTRIEIRRYGGEAERHSHGHHQIVLPVHGVLDMEIAGLADRVSATRAAVIPAGRCHGFAGSRDNSFLVVDIPNRRAGRAREGFWHAAGEKPFVEVDSSLEGFCGFLAEELRHGGFDGLRSTLAEELLVGALGRGLGIAREVLPAALARAVGFIDARYRDPITVAEVAAASGSSESRLHALFKQRLQVSPKRYIAGRRMKQAALLLEQDGLAIAEIALQVGYGDQSAFTRAFKREFGVAPARYRLNRHKDR